MAKVSGVEIEARHMRPRNIFAGIDGKASAPVCHERVLEVIEAIERADGSGKLIIRLRHEVVLATGRVEAAGVLLEGSSHQDRRLPMLQRALCVNEIEELVLYNRPTQVAAVLGTLKGLGKSRWGRQCRRHRAIAEETEGLTM